MWKPDVMLYHADCADGFGAAWAAWMRWGDMVEYRPVSYGQEPPDVTGRNVLIGDFSYSLDVLLQMASTAASVVLLDHHKTALVELDSYRSIGCSAQEFGRDVAARLERDPHANMAVLLDMEKSGARLVWEFCHPDAEVPTLINLIEDRDLWRFRYAEARPFGLWLRAEPLNFERWELISQELNDGCDSARIMSEAAAMQRFFDQKVSEIAALARWIELGGHSVVACNCPPMFASEVGHKLLDDYPSTPFVALYSDQEKARGYSLRSRDDREDVSQIARKFGGGGHRNAAGFGVPLP